MRNNYEFHFHPFNFNRNLGISQTVQVRTGMFYMWHCLAYKVVDLTTGKVIKDRCRST